MAEPLIDAYVINWAGTDHLDRCLGALSRASHLRAVTVIDPRRAIDPRAFGERFPGVSLIPVGRAGGYGAAANDALKMPRGRASHIALLDSGVEVEGDWGAALAAATRGDGRTGIAVPKLLFPHDRAMVFSLGMCLGAHGHIWESGYGRVDSDAPPGEREVAAPHWSAAVITRECAEGTGLFSRGFSPHFGMVDYSLRALCAGFHLVAAPGLVARQWRPVRAADDLRRSEYLADQLRLIVQWYPAPAALRALGGVLGTALFSRGTGTMPGNDLPDRLCRPKALARALGALPRATSRRLLRLFRKASSPAPCMGSERAIPAAKRVHVPGTACGGETPDRIMMGLNDSSLLRGWFELEREQSDGVPATRYRWMSREAGALLRAAGGGPMVLQLQIAPPESPTPPNTLRVFLNGVRQGEIAVDGRGWGTHRLRVAPRDGANELALAAGRICPDEAAGARVDVSLRVAEIGLFPPGSPLLRESL